MTPILKGGLPPASVKDVIARHQYGHSDQTIPSALGKSGEASASAADPLGGRGNHRERGSSSGGVAVVNHGGPQ